MTNENHDGPLNEIGSYHQICFTGYEIYASYLGI